MSGLLSTQKLPAVRRARTGLTARTTIRTDQLLIVMQERAPAAAWNSLPDGARLKALGSRRDKSATVRVQTQLGNRARSGVQLATAAPGLTTFDAMAIARKLASAALAERPRHVAIAVIGFDAGDTDRYSELLTEALCINAFDLPRYQQSSTPSALREIVVYGSGQDFDAAGIAARAAGNNVARWLAAMPPNLLDALHYRGVARTLAKRHGWTYRFHSEAALKKLGAGAFLAVAQGNASRDAGIVHLRYEPRGGTAERHVALVGKGIIFDTGGNNLKPFSSMLEMHIDMQGSAVALATLQALTALEAPLRVDCWLALTENRIGPTAYKSQDLVRALNGKTIQTIHTDAEGRMALADTLPLAARAKPDLIVDYATLTGACVTAVTTRYSGVFSNREHLLALLTDSGAAAGERVWPFPIGAEFREALKSPVADLMQCTADGIGDHILAASFLAEFVPETVPWVHIDLSAARHKGGLGLAATDLTGFGVRYTLELLLKRRAALFDALGDD